MDTSRFPDTPRADAVSSPQEGEAGTLHYSLQITLSILKEKAQFSFHFAWMKLLTAMHLNSVSSRIREGIAGCVFLPGTSGTFGSLVGAADA